MIKFLKENVYASYVLTLVRLYLGYEWIQAGWHKLTGAEPFNAQGFLMGAVKKATGDHPVVQSWWANFLDAFAIPNVGLFNFLVPYGEFLVGLGLILGALTTAAAFFGILMNYAFMFSGSTSTNVQMSLLTIFILVAGFNAGKIGLDRWIIPYIKKAVKKDATLEA
ncbi:MAG: DoxX family protein [Tepidibacillus sp.]|uniref:DoxX family protein n=1 Tax=Tepidibacillus sp. HK-1 TaxID=1883407 RepID=UPI000852F16D|nr:DoxX family protein [Tepidibacillus sp. HK-1]GBF11738.1 doxX protein [Tepidibacillus sp. HK-1]